jgi:hypothetical protein
VLGHRAYDDDDDVIDAALGGCARVVRCFSSTSGGTNDIGRIYKDGSMEVYDRST